MAYALRRIAQMKSIRIVLSVIAVILILLKLSYLRIQPDRPGGTLIPQALTTARQDLLPGQREIARGSHTDQVAISSIETIVYTKPWKRVTTITVTETRTETASSSPTLSGQQVLPLPAEYQYQSSQSEFCIDRFTTKYLDLLRDGRTDYCAQGKSSSSLSCFHTPSDLHDDGHLDSFCIGQDVHLDKDKGRFVLDCVKPDAEPTVPLDQLQGYWHQTGPEHIFSEFIKVKTLTDENTPTQSATAVIANTGARNFTILLKRDDAHNIYHSLHEIMSLTHTMDVLRMTRDTKSGKPFFKSPEDNENTQVVVLDDYPEGPYWDLWGMFSTKPLIRFSELAARNPKQTLEAFDNVIVPLAGASNPIWHDDWEKSGCINEIRRTFVKRVLEFYGIVDDKSVLPPEQLTMTIVDRKETRRLFHLKSLVEATRYKYPDVKIQVVDWGTLSLRKQVKIARKTDIFVGIHGAGLTQALFMKEGRGAMVEIMPDTSINCFHAIAMERNLHYFRAHGRVAEKKDDWHDEDVVIDQDKFIMLMDHAIKALYSRPGRFRDLYVEDSALNQ